MVTRSKTGVEALPRLGQKHWFVVKDMRDTRVQMLVRRSAPSRGWRCVGLGRDRS